MIINFTKHKLGRTFALFLIFCITLSFCSSNILVKADSDTTTKSTFTYDNNEWTFSVANTSKASPVLSLSKVGTNDKKVHFPNFKEFKSCSSLANTDLDQTLTLAQDNKNAFSSVKRIDIGNDYKEIPEDYLSGNQSIEEIYIDTDNEIVLSKNCFSSMSALRNVTIHAKSITLEGSVFKNCYNLETITFDGPTTFSGNSGSGYNFDQCQKLNVVKFNKAVSFEDSCNFTDTTFQNADSKSVTVTFNGTVTNRDTVFKQCNIYDLNLNGSNNQLSNNFLTNTSVTNLNVNGVTTFGQKAICFSSDANAVISNFNVNSSTSGTSSTTFEKKAFYSLNIDSRTMITNFTLNGQCVFSDAALFHIVIQNLYFNLDNRGDCKNISYQNDGDHLGYESRVHNLYFAYKKNTNTGGEMMELNHFPLGDDTKTSLNCDAIYFLDPDFKYIGGSDYNRCDGEKTIVYGYGGAVAYDDDGNLLSSYEMYQSWIKNKSCNFHNYVSNADTLDYEIKNNIVYLGENEDTVSYDFASETNLSVSATYDKDAINAPVSDGSKVKLSIVNGSLVSTNYNYRILEKNSSVSSSSKKVYAYNYNGAWYTPCTTSKVSLTEGTHDFLLEVAGIKHPFKIRVQKNAVQEITSIKSKTGDKLNLTVGEEVTKDMLVVTAKFDNGKTGILTDEQYEIDNSKVTDAETLIQISSKVSATKTVTKSFTVYGYPKQIVSFAATAAKENMPKDSVLHTSDVVLSAITYANPDTPVIDKVTDGFSFVVNGEEVQEVPIKLGENKISISYNGCVMKDIITINGTENTIVKVEATYTGNGVFENCTVDPANIKIVVYKESAETEGIVLDDPENITFGNYQIVADQNNSVPVFYKGIAAENPILVPGLKDAVAELTTVQYKGDTTIGTIFNASDFYVEVSLLSDKVLNSIDNPELLNALTFSKSTLTDTLNTVNVTFNSTYVKTITIFATGKKSEPPVSNPPSTTPTTNTTPSASTTPGSSDGPIKTQPPHTSNPPTKTPTTTAAATTTPTTTTPTTQTPIPTSTPKPSTKTIKKGKTYLVNSIIYKVVSIKGKTAQVSITGYKHTNKKITIYSKVKIYGYTCTVVSIQKNAFKNCKSLKGAISLPGEIRSIGDNAFANCSNITSITLGKKLISIGSKSFYNCKRLRLVNLKSAKKLKRVGSKAFKLNASKRQFKIPNGTKKYYANLLKGKY